MAGGGSINSTNVFAALDSLKKKKKSDKSGKGSLNNPGSAKEPELPPLFWTQKSTLEGKSWADIDDDDDYYAPPPPVAWGSMEQDKEIVVSVIEEESESEDDFVEGEEEEAEPDPEAPKQAEPVVERLLPAHVAPKDPERQLSKKELKKKELAELDAVLAELGISGKDEKSSMQSETNDVEEKKSEEEIGEGERKGNAPPPTESKTSKKKKKKEKPSKEVKYSMEQSNDLDVTGLDERVNKSDPNNEDKSAVDVKERLKRVVSMKKKKSSKEMDAAAKAAAIEAATRSAKLAAAKKKEKNHYNQQPLR